MMRYKKSQTFIFPVINILEFFFMLLTMTISFLSPCLTFNDVLICISSKLTDTNTERRVIQIKLTII